jgi:anti-sigma factor RsiW
LTVNNHIKEDELELYALDRLPGAKVSADEEHLLVCEECRSRLAQTDRYISELCEALRAPISLPGRNLVH